MQAEEKFPLYVLLECERHKVNSISLVTFFDGANKILNRCTLLSIYDWIYENHPKSHILYFKKYQFEIFKTLCFSDA